MRTTFYPQAGKALIAPCLIPFMGVSHIQVGSGGRHVPVALTRLSTARCWSAVGVRACEAAAKVIARRLAYVLRSPQWKEKLAAVPIAAVADRLVVTTSGIDQVLCSRLLRGGVIDLLAQGRATLADLASVEGMGAVSFLGLVGALSDRGLVGESARPREKRERGSFHTKVMADLTRLCSTRLGSSRNTRAFLAIHGFEGGKPMSLRAAAALVGVSHELVNQVCKRASPQFLSVEASELSNYPSLERFYGQLRLLRSGRLDQLAAKLEMRGRPADFENLVFFGERVLRLSWLASAEWNGVRVLLPSADSAHVYALVVDAMAGVSERHNGVIRFGNLCSAVHAIAHDSVDQGLIWLAAECFGAVPLDSAKDYLWAPVEEIARRPGQGAWRMRQDHPVYRELDRVLAVFGAVDADRAARALVRVMGGEMPLSASRLILVAKAAGFPVKGQLILSREVRRPRRPTQAQACVLTQVEQRMLEILVARGGELERREFSRACFEVGVERNQFCSYLARSPLFVEEGGRFSPIAARST